MGEFVEICISVVAPIFVLVAVGAWLERRFDLDVNTLTKLNFYVFVPGLIFTAIVKARIDWSSMLTVAVFQVVLILVLLIINGGIGKLLRLPQGLASAFLMATIFCNSGNFGIPLVRLAFPENPETAVSYQAIQVMVQNFLTFTLGLLIVGHGRARIADSLKATLRLPFVYVIAAALLVKRFDVPVMQWPILWEPLSHAAGGLVAVALLTLGVQMAKTPRVNHKGLLTVANFLRLAIAPLVAFALVRLFGITGMVAKLLVIAAAAPSAVNTVLVALEFENEPDFAASAVFYSTVFSAVTVAVTVFLVRWFM